MAQDLIPSIGAKGVWTALVPYVSAISPSSVYECVGVRKLADVIAAGEDGYTKYYKPFDVPLTDYIQDAKSGVCIISLISGKGQWAYIPSNKINATPSMTGVKYSRVVIGVQLGEVPDTLDLSPLTAAIELAVHHFLAIDASAQLAVTSATILKTQEEHDARMSGITAMRDLNKNDYSRNIELTAEVQSLRGKLAIAERYILDHQ